MKSIVLGIATAAILTSGACLAQTTQGGTAATPGTTAPMPGTTTPMLGTAATPGSTTGMPGSTAGMPGSTTGMPGKAAGTQGSGAGTQGNAAAASGNNNQAVATTNANAPMPAKGANSFTMGQVKDRIEKQGFANVSDLTKDNDGVWHGKAQKNGMSTPVWLDYKGNIGATQ